MIKRLIWTIWTPMSSVLKKADKLNLSLSLSLFCYIKWNILSADFKNFTLILFELVSSCSIVQKKEKRYVLILFCVSIISLYLNKKLCVTFSIKIWLAHLKIMHFLTDIQLFICLSKVSIAFIVINIDLNTPVYNVCCGQYHIIGWVILHFPLAHWPLGYVTGILKVKLSWNTCYELTHWPLGDLNGILDR